MMRTIVAILAISPSLLLAQANSPAQPGSTLQLQSNVFAARSLAAVKAENRSTESSRNISAYTPPKRIHTVELAPTTSLFPGNILTDRMVVVEMTVDTTGKPQNLTIAQSGGRVMDKAVLAAVSQYRYEPATLNGHAIPTPVKLDLTVQQGTGY